MYRLPSVFLNRAQYGVRTKPAQAVRLLCRQFSSGARSSSQPSSSIRSRQWSTPLAKQLAEVIATTGPIPISQYMRQCLTSQESGYYTSAGSQFGKEGDFVTSPEISQIFGELIGTWIFAEWVSQGKKNHGVQLIELGPGRGLLMDDVLRIISSLSSGNHGSMADAMETIYLVETSAMLRETQKEALCGPQPLEEHPLGKRAKSKHIPHVDIIWLEDINFLPQEEDRTPFIVANEFFDALPIDAFQSVPSKSTEKPAQNEWRELLVSPTSPPSVINPPKAPQPEFELILSQSQTRRSIAYPGMTAATEISERYKRLLPTAGATIEISMESLAKTEAVARLISAHDDGVNRPAGPRPKPTASGAALIIDYGPDQSIPISTLRGIRRHARCSPFEEPGRVDLSADVDFLALAHAALNVAPDIEVHGPAPQGKWIEWMGGRESCRLLMEKAEMLGDSELGKRIESSFNRLVDEGPSGMGKMYKFMAIIPDKENGKRRPAGFGGDIWGEDARS